MTGNQVLSLPEIKDDQMIKLIKECMQKITKLGAKLPSRIVWRESQIQEVGLTYFLEDVGTGNTMVNIVLNAGVRTQPKKFIQDTIYHELAHAATNDGHGPKWQALVAKVRASTGLAILETCTEQEVSAAYWEQGYKYLLRCTKCGQLIGFNSMNELVKDPGQLDPEGKIRFTHTGCGGSWERIK